MSSWFVFFSFDCVDISVVAVTFLSCSCEAEHSGSRWQSLAGKGKSRSGVDAGLGACTDWLLQLKFLWCWTAIKVSLLLLSLLNCDRDTVKKRKRKRGKNGRKCCSEIFTEESFSNADNTKKISILSIQEHNSGPRLTDINLFIMEEIPVSH